LIKCKRLKIIHWYGLRYALGISGNLCTALSFIVAKSCPTGNKTQFDMIAIQMKMHEIIKCTSIRQYHPLCSFATNRIPEDMIHPNSSRHFS
jgi:hypothetical protein